MTIEQIEEASEKHSEQWLDNSDEYFRSHHRDVYEYGFIAGAQWRINSVWHDANKKPDKNQLVVFECRKTYGRGYSVNFGENYDLLKNVLLRWAYVIDLLPERKEETE